MRVAIIGANGQLGNDLSEAFSNDHDVTALNHADFEISDIDNVKNSFDKIKPELVLNTAASHIVPKCEENPAQAFQVNGTGVLNLARVCQDRGIRLVHYSTDYVFDGKKGKPYNEDDRPNPLNVYGSTKLAGEQFALNYCEKSYVIRVSGIYGKVPCRAKGGNFITTMLRLAKEKSEVRVVDDEVLTPTPTTEIAANTKVLVNTEAYGLYHMTCEGEVSWYAFAQVIWDTLKLKTPLYPASVKDFPVAVKRPFYSVLENRKFTSQRMNSLPHWKEALELFLTMNFAS